MVATVSVSDELVSKVRSICERRGISEQEFIEKAIEKAVKDDEDTQFLKGLIDDILDDSSDDGLEDLLSELGLRGLSSPRASRRRPSSCRC